MVEVGELEAHHRYQEEGEVEEVLIDQAQRMWVDWV